MEVLILGGGVVGVTTAYQLLKDGHQVLVIDRPPPSSNQMRKNDNTKMA